MCVKFQKKYIYLIIILLCIIFVSFTAGKYLILEDPLPHNVDIIMSFESGLVRHVKAYNLKKRYYQNSQWIISCLPSLKKRLYNEYDNSVFTNTIFYHAAEGTIDEVRFLKKELHRYRKNNSLKTISVCVVSSDYHLKRIQMTISKIVGDKNIDYHYIPYKTKGFTPKKWYSNKKTATRVISEWFKIIGYMILYWN